MILLLGCLDMRFSGIPFVKIIFYLHAYNEHNLPQQGHEKW